MTDRFDRLLAIWIGLAFPVALVAAPRGAQFFIGAGLAIAIAAMVVEDRRDGRTAVDLLKSLPGAFKRRMRFSDWLPAYLLVAFGVYALASALWSIDPAFSAERAGRFLVVSLLAVGFVALAAPRLGRLEPLWVVAGAAAAAALCVLDWVTGAHVLRLTDRPEEWLEYNRVAQQCAALVFFAFWCPPSKRIVVFAALLLISGFVALSENETAKVALTVSLVVLVLCALTEPKRAVAVSAAAFTAIVLAIPLVQPALLDIVGSAFPDLFPERSHQLRLHIWSHIGAMLPDHALFGAGFDATRHGPPIGEVTLFDGTIETYPTPFHPHGQVLQIAYETGAVGLVFFIAFGLALIHRIGRLAEARIPLALALFWGTFAAANIANGAFATWRLAFWAILIAMVIGIAFKGRSESAG